MIRGNINLPIDDIAGICRAHHVRQLSIFGSALRDDCRADSDVDFLVAFENDDCRPWMSRLTEVEEALAALLKRDVDVVYKPGIEQSRNRLRGDAILASAQVIYGA